MQHFIFLLHFIAVLTAQCIQHSLSLMFHFLHTNLFLCRIICMMYLYLNLSLTQNWG
jgi:hypothetical protein